MMGGVIPVRICDSVALKPACRFADKVAFPIREAASGERITSETARAACETAIDLKG